MTTLRIRHIKKVRAKGRLYYYDRISGRRIHAPFGSPEFLAELETARQAGPEKKPSHREKPGTFGALVTRYRASPEFQSLAPRTRADYQRVLDYLKPLHYVPLADFTPAYIVLIRDRANTKHKWRFANYVLAVISVVFNWGQPRGLTDRNPAQSVPKIKRPKALPQAHRPWTDEELRIVTAAAPPAIARAIMISAYTGMREGDVLSLPVSAIDNGNIRWRQSKTGEEIAIPIHADLARHLQDHPPEGDYLVGSRSGQPYTGSGFRCVFFRLIRQMEKDGKIAPGLTFHGLRHTVATRLAEAGADDFTIQTILGHKTALMAQRYRRAARKSKATMKGISLLRSNKTGA